MSACLRVCTSLTIADVSKCTQANTLIAVRRSVRVLPRTHSHLTNRRVRNKKPHHHSSILSLLITALVTERIRLLHCKITLTRSSSRVGCDCSWVAKCLQDAVDSISA
ncbi:hypothetical protein ILYODFUR_011281 [Ilyodon furcidens]|uniref:Secreted protein n=1 Tax=Ilyodon furcidens TaxID=33524 RepID=A0ABV0UHD9_9TELE